MLIQIQVLNQQNPILKTRNPNHYLLFFFFHCETQKLLLQFKNSAHDKPKSQVGLIIDSSQRKDKISYYYSFKTQLGSLPWVKSRSLVGLTIDLDQRKDKNNNYYSFKTRLGSQFGARPRLRARLPLTSVNIGIKIVITIILKPN